MRKYKYNINELTLDNSKNMKRCRNKVIFLKVSDVKVQFYFFSKILGI